MRAARRAAVPPALTEADRRRVFAAVSVLLGYPDRRLAADLPLLQEAASSIPAPAGDRLIRFLQHVAAVPEEQRGAEYVETFDLRRRCCLYLTYYLFGDTRRRGVALVRFTSAYRGSGLEPPEGELPDHLAVVCNFAALDLEAGTALIQEHRAGVELLRLALADARSPYCDLVDAVRDVLPAPLDTDVSRAADLARSGPPAEEVGLEPFAPPEYMGGRR